MPLYTFELRDGSRGIEDEVTLPNREQALRYAHDVVRELMSWGEAQTRTWCLNVCEDHGPTVFEIPFASVDSTLDDLSPELRTMMERLCDRHRALNEVIHAAHLTVQESRALVALSRGKPYLAAAFGRTTISRGRQERQNRNLNVP